MFKVEYPNWGDALVGIRMTDTIRQIDARRHPRYCVAPGKTIPVVIQAMADRSPFSRGEIRDISRGGAKLIVDGEVPVGATVGVRFEARAAGLAETLPMRVCWARSNGSAWNVGCQFVEELAVEWLDRLAAAGWLDRRQELRRDVLVPARLKCELTDEQTVAVVLTNFSAGGVQIESPTPGAAGQRLLIELSDGDGRPIRIPMRAVWTQPCDGRHRIGCSYLNNEGAEIMRRLIPLHDRLEASSRDPSLPLAPWVWKGLAAVIAWFLVWFGIRALELLTR